eukprot:s2006_g5.t1
MAAVWGYTGMAKAADSGLEMLSAFLSSDRMLSGIRAGMWAGEAFQLCPDLVVMPYEFDSIMETAELFYRTVLDTTPYVQGISCDEVFADVSHLVQDDVFSWQALARKIRADIWSLGCHQFSATAPTFNPRKKPKREEGIWAGSRSRSGCVASIGVAKNRLLARLATKFAKPRPGCKKCGKAALDRVQTVGDLRNVPLAKLRELFGEKQAQSLFRLSRGIDDRPWDPRPPRKSVGAQIAWGVRFEDTEALRHFVAELTTEALRRLARHGRRGSSLTVKFATDPGLVPAVEAACAEAWRLCESTGATPAQVRGFGIHIGGLEKAQPSIPSLIESQKPQGLEKVILHLDVDCFFLAVHEKYDPSLKEAGPLVLWQYNDVICISPEAKAAGVKKHMRPSEAQPLVEPWAFAFLVDF